MISKSVEETSRIAEEFLKQISASIPGGGATVVGLFGDLGSGKTTFTQAVGKLLNIKEMMTSPTFVIQKRYKITPNPKFRASYSTLIHIDAYRLESGKELLSLNLAEDMMDPKNLILIEWPERVAEVLPENMRKISFRFVSETEREIVL